jgi:hypothetical protein
MIGVRTRNSAERKINTLHTKRHIRQRERIVDGHLRKLRSFPAAFVVHDIRSDPTGGSGLRKEVIGPGGARERYEHAIVNAVVLREEPKHDTQILCCSVSQAV